MWPFSPRQKPGRDWEDRLERVERRVRDIETDWAQTYDKFHRLSMRLAKRVKDEEKTAEDAPQGQNGPRPTTSNPLAQRILHGGIT